jgi:hypothetical protein
MTFLKTPLRIYLCIVYILIGSAIAELFSQKIYGFKDRYFVSIDIHNQVCDSLIEFPQRPYINLNFSAAIDRFNGRYFFGGSLSGHPGNFHIIDLVTLSITSATFYTGDMEYDPFEDKIYYLSGTYFYSLALNEMKPIRLAKVFQISGRIFGQVRTYLAQKNEYVYRGPENTIAFVNPHDGNTICKITPLNSETSFCSNLITDDIYSINQGSIYVSKSCSYSRTYITSIPDYKGHANVQMAVFDHTKNLYIVPYWAQNNQYKYAIINIEKAEVEQTFEQFCLPALMDLQMIYDKPEALVRISGDTIYVPLGQDYSWYLNDSLICYTKYNYLIPNQNGRYKARVHFREYSSYTREIIIGNVKSSAFEYELRPSLANNRLGLIFNDCNYEQILIHDIQGKIIFNKVFTQMKIHYEQDIDLFSFPRGLYIVTAFHNNKPFSKKFIRY